MFMCCFCGVEGYTCGLTKFLLEDGHCPLKAATLKRTGNLVALWLLNCYFCPQNIHEYMKSERTNSRKDKVLQQRLERQ